MWKDYGSTTSCGEFSYPLSDEDTNRKDIRGNTKNGPVVEVIMVTKHLDRFGIEFKIDSTQRDGRDSILDGYQQRCSLVRHGACRGSQKAYSS